MIENTWTMHEFRTFARDNLSKTTRKRLGQLAASVPTHEFEPFQLEQMVLSYVEKHGEISRAEAAELCQISGPQAYRLLKKLEQKGQLIPIGRKGRAVRYERRAEENAR